MVEAVKKKSGLKPIGPSDPFRALRAVSPAQVKVVIIGQDPYPTPGQADGMAFSAEKISPRPSLRRIFDVLEADRPGWRRPLSGRLDAWAAQGVLLLNTVLTVEEGAAGSHLDVSWQILTSQIINAAADFGVKPVAFAWGTQAKNFVDMALAAKPGAAGRKPLQILQTRHPSNDFRRDFMSDGSHFAATADRIDWWTVGTQA